MGYRAAPSPWGVKQGSARTEIVVHVDVAQPWLRAIAAARVPRRRRVRLAGHARV
jgi:hypothetical protein